MLYKIYKKIFIMIIFFNLLLNSKNEPLKFFHIMSFGIIGIRYIMILQYLKILPESAKNGILNK